MDGVLQRLAAIFPPTVMDRMSSIYPASINWFTGGLQSSAAIFARSVTMNTMWRICLTILLHWLTSLLYISQHTLFMPNNMPVAFLEGCAFTACYYLHTFDMVGGITLLVAQLVCSFMVYHTFRTWGTAFIMSNLMTWYPGFFSFMITQYVKTIVIQIMTLVTFFHFSMSKNTCYILFYLGCAAYYYFRLDIPRSRVDIYLAAIILGYLRCLYYSRYEFLDACLIAILLLCWMTMKSQGVPRRCTFMRPNLDVNNQ